MITTLFNNTFQLLRPERTSDGAGGWLVSWSDEGRVAGRLRPASAGERELAAQERRELTHVFYCAADGDIRRGDRLVLGTLVVEVLDVREPSLAGHHLEVFCREWQP